MKTLDRRVRWLTTATTLLGCAGIGPAEAQAPDDVLAVYSNFCIGPESGDLRGERMILFRVGNALPSKEDFYVLYQGAGEVPRTPILEKAVVTGDQIRIEIHIPHIDLQSFVGHVTPEAIEGTYTNNGRQIVLKRQAQAKNRFPYCR